MKILKLACFELTLIFANTENDFAVRKKTKLLQQLTLQLRQKIGANLLTLFSVERPTFWWEKLQGTMRFRNLSIMHKSSKPKLTKFTKVNVFVIVCLEVRL